MDIVLSANDDRLGAYAPDGSFEKWPVKDVFGNEYERSHATVHRLSASAFVVVPPDGEKNIETLTIEKNSHAQTFAPVSQQVAKRKQDEE
jgi:hypothetical protein